MGDLDLLKGEVERPRGDIVLPVGEFCRCRGGVLCVEFLLAGLGLERAGLALLALCCTGDKPGRIRLHFLH